AALLHCALAQFLDQVARDLLVLPVEEDAFGMLACKGDAATGSAGLPDHGRALRRWLAEMDRIELVVGPAVLDAVNLRGARMDAADRVALFGVVGPTAFPELVDRVHVVVRTVVALVVGHLSVGPHAACGTVEAAGDHVP